MRRVRRIAQVLSSLDAAAMAEQNLGQRIVVVGVAVGHVTAEQNDRMIQQRAVAIGYSLEALGKLRKNRRVIVLDQPQVGNTFRKSSPMRRGVEGLADPKVLV